VLDDTTVEEVTFNGISTAALWRIDEIPVVPGASVFTDYANFTFPSPAGLLVCTFTVPPNISIDDTEGVVDIAYSDARPGYHSTDTVDIDLVIAGEVFLEIEDGSEVRLAAGDTVVLGGTGHAWHNRSDAPATLLIVMYGARRAAP
jgi:hypothetical protein